MNIVFNMKILFQQIVCLFLPGYCTLGEPAAYTEGPHVWLGFGSYP